jgi:hypothetical protein
MFIAFLRPDFAKWPNHYTQGKPIHCEESAKKMPNSMGLDFYEISNSYGDLNDRHGRNEEENTYQGEI